MLSVPKNCFVSWIALIIGAAILLGVSSPLTLAAPPQADGKDQVEPRPGHLIKVSLPINDRVRDDILASLDAIVREAPPQGPLLKRRPVVVLEFDTRAGKTGSGSDREACQKLARLLTDNEDFNLIETIAYIPASETLGGAAGDENGTRLVGHAVLVALAANRLALAPGASIGDAGIDEDRLDESLPTIYRTQSAKRGLLPPPMVASMLDSSLGLAWVVKNDEPTFVDIAELEDLEGERSAAGRYPSTCPSRQASCFIRQPVANVWSD